MQPSKHTPIERETTQPQPAPSTKQSAPFLVNPTVQSGNTGELVLLRHMAFRRKGIICKVDAGGELGRRIRDMGIVPGTRIELQGRAPLNDPVTVKIRECTLALRNNEADHIWVGVEDERDE